MHFSKNIQMKKFGSSKNKGGSGKVSGKLALIPLMLKHFCAIFLGCLKCEKIQIVENK
eukprot:UN22908